VSQLSLINMNERKVSEMGFLSGEEKEILQRRLKEYHLRISTVEYSRKLTKFFALNNAEALLTKLQHKKAK
jgi:Fe2+ transport system protein FeoA